MAETKNLANLRSFGDMDCDVFVAPLGTAEPTDLDLLPAPWEALGWLSEDGASEGLSVDVVKFKLYQGGATGRTKTNGTEKTFGVQAAEHNPLVLGLFYGSQPATVTGVGDAAIAKLEIPEGIGTVARAVALKFVDEDIIYIRYNTRAEVTDRGTAEYNNGSLTVREMTFDLIGKDYWLTNDPAIVGTGGA